MKTKEEISNELAHCTGTQCYYKYMFGLKLTEGSKAMADLCQAYWLLDVIASYLPKAKDKDFVLCKLKLNKNGGAKFTMQEDSGITAFVTQEIPFTDFPLDEIKLYLIDNVLLLPSEY